jgi:hypothetical protein
VVRLFQPRGSRVALPAGESLGLAGGWRPAFAPAKINRPLREYDYGIAFGLQAAHCEKMLRFLPDPITAKELAALRLILDRPLTRDIDGMTRDRLLLLGYARIVLGGLVVTDEGFRVGTSRDALTASKQP